MRCRIGCRRDPVINRGMPGRKRRVQRPELIPHRLPTHTLIPIEAKFLPVQLRRYAVTHIRIREVRPLVRHVIGRRTCRPVKRVAQQKGLRQAGRLLVIVLFQVCLSITQFIHLGLRMSGPRKLLVDRFDLGGVIIEKGPLLRGNRRL